MKRILPPSRPLSLSLRPASLYNNQDQLLNFAEYTTEPADLVSGQPGEFEVYVDTNYQAVARYELRAWE